LEEVLNVHVHACTIIVLLNKTDFHVLKMVLISVWNDCLVSPPDCSPLWMVVASWSSM